MSNDANCAAYAETHHGAATDSSHVLYLTGTVGIGAGIVEGGDLVRGAAGFAGEVGHMPVGEPSALCGCGRQGCWEASIGLHRALGFKETGRMGKVAYKFDRWIGTVMMQITLK